MTPPVDEQDRLPQPFEPAAWPTAIRPAATALWDWHLATFHVAGDSLVPAAFAADKKRVEAGELPEQIPAAVTEAAYAACRAHDLPLALLAEQVGAAARLAGPARFDTYADLHAFVRQSAGAHARLLGRLAGLKGSWQQKPLGELARAYFLTGRLLYLPEDLARDRLFIPLDEMQQAGVSLAQVRDGRVDEAARRLFWKQTVRIRDAFAQGQTLAKDLSGRQARIFKRWWLGGLYALGEIERRDYDVWSQRVRLSALRRFQIRLQAFIGKTSFR